MTNDANFLFQAGSQHFRCKKGCWLPPSDFINYKSVQQSSKVVVGEENCALSLGAEIYWAFKLWLIARSLHARKRQTSSLQHAPQIGRRHGIALTTSCSPIKSIECETCVNKFALMSSLLSFKTRIIYFYSPKHSISPTSLKRFWAGIRKSAAESWKPCVIMATSVATTTIIQPKPASG